ncbi:uncharacterized protein EI97DRAFT_447481 [Westerdykella ornata]|uniref:LysM domain-containing protein n=1 Tax=Westerdykella ornata TaxID=318751 RepID=A0A6A6JZA0_WESOR|nr:uncharacterized protein EI97DRAFT_447481 [Westerdykella ornata]KAF2281535.1 hypothetical protein EI97DRAFT_447481 [Westerdykella ornata]
MRSTTIFALGLFLGHASATARLSIRGVDCDFAIATDSGATCQKFNTDINCPDLDTGKPYCVMGTVNNNSPTTGQPPSTTLRKSTISKAPTTTKAFTTTANASSVSPTMPGLAGNLCTIANKHGISVAQFMSWNTYINARINLWLDYYVCVHVPGAATTTKQTPQPTNTPSGPTPQMPNIVANCNRFYKVKSGDSCWSIYTNAGITLNQFLSWNKAVDSSCSNLWLDYYVCVGV